EIEGGQQYGGGNGGRGEEVQRGEKQNQQQACDQRPAEWSAAPVWQVRQQRADDVQVDDRLVRHRSKSVPARRVGPPQVRAAVPAELARRHCAFTVWAQHQRWRGWGAGDLASSPAGPMSSLTDGWIRAPAPPLLMQVIQAVSSASSSMLPA